MDGQLLGGLLLICGVGLVVLYIAVGEDMDLLLQQCVRLSVAIAGMFVVAQVPPDVLRRWTPWGYGAGLVLLILVLTFGEVGQGAKRWLDLGIRFQPSEIMKLAVPAEIQDLLVDARGLEIFIAHTGQLKIGKLVQHYINDIRLFAFREALRCLSTRWHCQCRCTEARDFQKISTFHKILLTK